MIFWTVIFSFTAAKLYDNREKKKAQKKWCDMVAHLSQERLDIRQMPRKMTVFLSAVPGDGIGSSRQYFKDYIKPILVAASMDYEVIEGRKEGDVRYGTAEQIRRLRRKRGEKGLVEPELDAVMAVDMMRERMMVEEETGVKGDLVLGRHTWKEYVRGLHEGWLGPLDEPPEQSPSTDSATLLAEPSSQAVETPIAADAKEGTENLEAAEGEKKEEEKPAEEKKEEPKKVYPPPAYLSIREYATAPLSPHIPQVLGPSEPIYQQHLLGFLKTPQRVWNWLNRRSLQDQIGRQTAMIVLAHSRPFQQDETYALPSSSEDSASLATKAPEYDATESSPILASAKYEQQNLLEGEERFWHKSVRKPRPSDDQREQIWLPDIVLEPRIAQRMRKFELEPEEEERAKRIGEGLEQGRAVPVQDLRQEKPIIGSLDQDSME